MYSLEVIISVIVAGVALVLVIVVGLYRKTKWCDHDAKLPPGSFGWPVLGETLEFMQAHRDGTPERFVRDRMKKHDNSRVFKTCLMGEKVAVFVGPAGNKFLFSNENKLVSVWWPISVQRLLGNCLATSVGEQAKKLRKLLMGYFGPDALATYVDTMDQVTRRHLISHWQGRKEVKVYQTTELFTFELACGLLMRIEDKDLVSKLFAHFSVFIKGILSIPFNIPRTRFYKAMRATVVIREELKKVIRQRRQELEKNSASSSHDLISHLLVTSDEDGRFLSEMEIVDNILNLLFASYDTTGTTITLVMKYLAEMPNVYEKVLNEQSKIASQKEPGEPLHWEDIQKMKYSWNVISEILRFKPPVSGSYREALVDFTYEGYTIPKGWKLFWSASFTHKDPSVCPGAEIFDETRFDKAAAAIPPFSFVPFGGGPRMCLGKEFARPVILTFLHHVVNRFKWNLLNPDERTIYDPMPIPVEGLPVRLQPLKTADC